MGVRCMPATLPIALPGAAWLRQRRGGCLGSRQRPAVLRCATAARQPPPCAADVEARYARSLTPWLAKFPREQLHIIQVRPGKLPAPEITAPTRTAGTPGGPQHCPQPCCVRLTLTPLLHAMLPASAPGCSLLLRLLGSPAARRCCSACPSPCPHRALRTHCPYLHAACSTRT